MRDRGASLREASIWFCPHCNHVYDDDEEFPDKRIFVSASTGREYALCPYGHVAHADTKDVVHLTIIRQQRKEGPN